MKRWWVFGVSLLFLTFLLPIVFSQSISLDLPSQVDYNEEFTVTLNLIDFSSDVYDVKIDITTSNGTRLSEILDSESWHSTYSYIASAIDTSKSASRSFKLKIVKSYSGQANVEVKVRSSSDKVSTFSDYSLNIISSGQDSSQEITNESSSDDTKTTDSSENSDDKISLEINSGKTFQGEETIEVSASNLKSGDYDLKIYISEDEDSSLISENYNEDEDSWKSGNYYLTGLFNGPDDDSKEVKMRIKKSSSSFSGDAVLTAKIRKSGSSTIIYSISKDIEVEESTDSLIGVDEENLVVNTTSLSLSPSSSNQEEVPKVIHLSSVNNSKDPIQKDYILYESSGEKTKKYLLYGFNIILLAIIIFLIFKRL
jgi:hypothetical protein